MYHVDPVIQFKHFHFSTDMYYVSPTINFLNQTDDVNFVQNLQDKVLTKLKVLLHNIQHLAKSTNIQIPCVDIIDEKLIEVQEDVIKRILKLSGAIQTVALKSKIDISHISMKELDTIQSEVNEKIYALKNKIEYLASSNGNIILDDKNRPINISIIANSSKPPLSVLLLLSGLKSKGYKVACESYCNRIKSTASISTISNFIRNNLSIADKRQSYDLIVSLIWTNLDINDCIYQDNVFKDTKMFGEMMAFINLCKHFSLNIRENLMNIESLNDDLYYSANTKRALILLSKLMTEINGSTEANLALSVFIISCLMHSKTISKINESLKEKLYSVLELCGSDANNFINMKM